MDMDDSVVAMPDGGGNEGGDDGGTTTGSQDLPEAGFLHVIFHGLFCFFELNDHILVRAPKVGSMGHMGHMGHMEHSYRAGNWLGEVTYNPGQYEMLGVQPGYAKFPRKFNLVLDGGTPAASPAELYAEMIFPYPDDIKSIQRLPIDPMQLFTGASLDLVKGTTEIATLQVFTYRFDDHLKLKLDNHPWSADGQMVGGFTCLHIFAEPDRQMPRDMLLEHVKGAFAAAMKMYAGVDLKMAKDPDQVPQVTMNQIPFGARIEEMQDLNLRLSKVLTKLGRMKKRGDNLNQLWDEGELDGSDVERCSHSIGVRRVG